MRSAIATILGVLLISCSVGYDAPVDYKTTWDGEVVWAGLVNESDEYHRMFNSVLACLGDEVVNSGYPYLRIVTGNIYHSWIKRSLVGLCDFENAEITIYSFQSKSLFRTYFFHECIHWVIFSSDEERVNALTEQCMIAEG